MARAVIITSALSISLSLSLSSGPDEPCVWLRIDVFKHPCVIVFNFNVVTVDPQGESIAVCLHVPDAFVVLNDSADGKPVEWDSEVSPFHLEVVCGQKCLHRGSNPGPTD